MPDGSTDHPLAEDNRVWTPDMDMQLISARRDGASLAQMAAALGVTRSAVAGRVMRLRNAGRLERLTPAPDTAAPPTGPRRSLAAADRLGQAPSAQVWRRHLDAIGNPPGFPPDVDLALVEGLARGLSLAWVARDLGLEAGAARARFFALLPVTGIEAQRLLMDALRARVAGVQA